MEILIPKSYFLKLFTKMIKTHEFPMDFKHFFFVQIHLKKSNFIFVARLRREDPGRETCSTSAVILMIFFWPLHLRPCIHRAVRARSFAQTHFSPPKKTYCKTPMALTILTKPTVKPQCRCSCDFCRTSPTPLLEIFETSLNPS